MNYLVSELITILSSKKYNLIEDKKITGGSLWHYV